MKKLLFVAAFAVLANGSVLAAEPSTMTPSSGNHAFMTAVPSDGYTVKDWYKQNVYDPAKIFRRITFQFAIHIIKRFCNTIG